MGSDLANRKKSWRKGISGRLSAGLLESSLEGGQYDALEKSELNRTSDIENNNKKNSLVLLNSAGLVGITENRERDFGTVLFVITRPSLRRLF